MPNNASPPRLWITAGVLVAAFVLLHGVSHGEVNVPRRALAELPLGLGVWVGTEQPLADAIVRAVGVTDYVNRFYASPAGFVHLYVGYYASQRTGDTIHSPKNCLPGAGWDPVRSGSGRLVMPDGREILVNQYVIQQGLDQQLVFYWYQGRGRVIASEYLSKFWMAADAVSRNRTDGALVRVMTPIRGSEEQARALLEGFTRAVFPSLDGLVPK